MFSGLGQPKCSESCGFSQPRVAYMIRGLGQPKWSRGLLAAHERD